MSLTASQTLEAVQSIEVISGHPRVALELIELSRTPNVEVADYAALIGTDVSLSGRILGLVNSACYAPEDEIMTVERALCTLGLRQARVIALSHCVASLHQALAIQGESARSLWAMSMTKGIAARKVAEQLGLEELDAAFTAGLLQDMGLALLHSLDPQAMIEIHARIDSCLERTLQAEVEHFGLNHSEVGQRMADKLNLPDFYRRAIESHHGCPDDLLRRAEGLELAVGVAGLLPHRHDNWSGRSMDYLASIVEERLPGHDSLEEFLVEVQDELADLDRQLGTSSTEVPDLLDGLIYASQVHAQESLQTVANNIWLREDSSSLNERLHNAKRAHEEAEQRADRDPLTQLFNRHGWDRRARVTLRQAGDDESSLGVAFFDLDHFKELNDDLGHAAGDTFLQEVGRRMTEAVREDDLICRWGGDEFVVLFVGADATDCLEAARRVKEHVQARPVVIGGQGLRVSITAGFVSVEAGEKGLSLSELLQVADEQLYKAKSIRRGTFSSTEVD